MHFSEHARQRMAERNVGEEDVRAILAPPISTYGPTKRACLEHYGRTADGRALTIVTNAGRAVAVTVVDA